MVLPKKHTKTQPPFAPPQSASSCSLCLLLLTLHGGIPSAGDASRFLRGCPLRKCHQLGASVSRTVKRGSWARRGLLWSIWNGLVCPSVGTQGMVLGAAEREPGPLVPAPPHTASPSLWSSPQTLFYFPLLVFLTRIPHTWTKPVCNPGGHQ